MTIQTKFYLALISFVIAAISMVGFIIYPLFKDIKNNSLVSQKENLAALEAKFSNLQELKILYNDFQPNLEKIDNLFVNPEVPVEFISFLEKTAKENSLGVKISLIPSQQKKEDVWPSLRFQIESSSSFPNFLKFLEKLETASYLIEILDLNAIKTSQSLSGPAEIKTIFSIKVYSKPR